MVKVITNPESMINLTRLNGNENRMFSAEIDLPKITDLALKRLKEWGFSDSATIELQRKMAPLEYRKCVAKLERLKEIYIHKDTTTQKSFALINNFFNVMGRGDGQCADLAEELLFDLSVSDYFKKHGIRDVDYCLVNGLSKTHFSKEPSRHVWLELLHKDILSFIKGKNYANPKGVIIDPSFRQISTCEESGYHPKEAIKAPRCIHRSPSQISEIGNFSSITPDNSFKLICKSPVIVGMTQDMQYTVGLAFAEYQNIYVPLIRLGHSNEVDFILNFISPVNQKLVTYIPDSSEATLSLMQEGEVKAMLNACQKLIFKPMSDAPVTPTEVHYRSW